MESNVDVDCGQISAEVGISEAQVKKTVELLVQGNTVFYLARFARHLTGGLAEEQLRKIAQSLHRCRELTERKSAILTTLANRNRTTPELENQIRAAPSMRQLDDLYGVAKSKKRNKASAAIGRGLQQLADEIYQGTCSHGELPARAASFINEEREVNMADEAIDGALDIIAQRMSEQVNLRETMRQMFRERGLLVASRFQDRVPDDPSDEAPIGLNVEQPAEDLSRCESTAENRDTVGTSPQPPDGDVLTSLEDITLEADQTDPLRVSPDLANKAGETPQQGAGETLEQRRERRRDLRRRRRLKLEASFQDCYSFKEPVSQIRPHQWLKLDRGERVLALMLKIDVEQEIIQQTCMPLLVTADHPHQDRIAASATSAIFELAYPVISRQIKQEMVQRARSKIVERLTERWQHILLQLPLERRTLAIHPAPSGNYAVAALDKEGTLLGTSRLVVSGTADQVEQAWQRIAELIDQHKLRVIAIGNSGGGREAEQCVGKWLENKYPSGEVVYTIVNSSGTDQYAKSALGAEELPELDYDTRRAVAIGRRLIDPLGECVKVDPLGIDFGCNRADIKLEDFAERFEFVTRFCVNSLGVDVNRSGAALIQYIAGLDADTARRLVEKRLRDGDFQSREQLVDTMQWDPSVARQAVGFLRIINGSQPLDQFTIHPDDYGTVEKLLLRLNIAAVDLVGAAATRYTDDKSKQTNSTAQAGNSQLSESPPVSPVDGRQKLFDLDKRQVAKELDVEIPRLEQLVEALLAIRLEPPQFSPLDHLSRSPSPPLRSRLPNLENLASGVMLLGKVVNIVKFGVFVDIGLPENGLIHISRLANQFVADPRDIVDIGQPINVWVVDIDRDKGRVGLTAIEPGTEVKLQRIAKTRLDSPRDRGRTPKRDVPTGRRGKRSARSGTVVDQRPRRKKKSKIPVVPISEEMKAGREPLRSFGDLKQFYESDKTKDKTNDEANDQPATDVEKETTNGSQQ